MDFTQSNEEIAFKNKVENCFTEKIKPAYPEWKTNNTTPKLMFQLLGQAELLGFQKKQQELQPIPWLQNIHYYKTAAQFSGGLAIASFAHSQLGLQALYYFGSPKQKTEYLLPGAAGDKIIAFANTEPGAGSDAAAIALIAEDNGDEFILNGTKSYITNGDIADHIILTAITHPDAEKKHKRISMVMVDAETDGLSRSRMMKHAWKISHLATLNFKNVRISKDNIIGQLNRGFYQTMDVFNTSRIGISAVTFGTAIGSYKLAFKHANKRKAFDKLLIEHESKKNEFADHIARLEACWLLIQKAAFLKDTGKEFRFNSSMAKLITTEDTLKIANWATELLGARGILEPHPISAYPMDAKASMVGEGAPEVQKKIIAENLKNLIDDF
jgi:alkylation response protein AidB-like acyl-CoA dehydrogenase